MVWRVPKSLSMYVKYTTIINSYICPHMSGHVLESSTLCTNCNNSLDLNEIIYMSGCQTDQMWTIIYPYLLLIDGPVMNELSVFTRIIYRFIHELILIISEIHDTPLNLVLLVFSGIQNSPANEETATKSNIAYFLGNM